MSTSLVDNNSISPNKSPSEKIQQLMNTFENAQKDVSSLETLISQTEAIIESEEAQLLDFRRVISGLEEERHVLRKEQDGLLEFEKSLLQELAIETQKKQTLYQDIVKAEDEANKLKNDISIANQNYSTMLMSKNNEYLKIRASIGNIN